MTEEYDMIDRFLRNNLYDDDYETFSAALDELAYNRENETNERNLCQLTDELADARRENAELKAKIESIQAFATLVRNETLDLAKEVCRQVVRETNSTLTWEGCKEIQEALEKEKA